MQIIKELVRTLARIYWSTDKRFTNRIFTTWLKVFILKRFDRDNRMADIVGFKVNFLDHYLLSFLYNELFIKNDYCFTTEKTDPFIVDCGSNIGMSILYFKMLYPQSMILGFEPGEETFQCLRANIQNNTLNSVKVYPFALSNKEGHTDFYYDPENLGSLYMSTISERFPMRSRKVETTLLSKYINTEVDFLKIDIEGAEITVLQELNTAGKLNLIKQMAIEYHHHIRPEIDDFSAMLGILEDAGFGYQIDGQIGRPLNRGQFQDILVYAYQK